MKQQYKSYQESCDFLYQKQKEYPDLVRVESIGTTYENRDILLATISLDIKEADKKPALLYTGTIHAREWIGNELAIAFVDYLLKNYKKNPYIYQTLKDSTLYIVPILNPDGFEYSRNHFSFWRKNRRNNGDGTFGVDLNRNFSEGFKKITNTSSNVYGGPYPFSEPETRAIKEFVDNHTNITIALDYHSQGNVFFPAHKFHHEPEIEGTDLNTLCANMNYRIQKTTGRKYGIHRGKPPIKLISGSGREYYYSKGIIATVVEVGTRNIPDFLTNMTESINENIPALLYALSETKNYSKAAPSRVENFTIEDVGAHWVSLKWDYEVLDGIYFEIYRTKNNKMACNEDSFIGITNDTKWRDENLESGELYFYYVRVIDKKRDIKSPYAPKVRVKTLLDEDEFSKTIYPLKNKVGYVAQNTLEMNRSHFGKNSLFVGVNESRGIHYGMIEIDLSSIPKDAIIKSAKISLYPLNRVNAKIEKYGEWSIVMLDSDSIADITDYNQVKDAKVLESVGNSIPSDKLTQGIWSHWVFNDYEKKVLQKQIKNEKVIFRVQGPTKLPLGRDSQVMMFDLGYGDFGGGIHYRPHIDIKYTIPSKEKEIETKSHITISQNNQNQDKLISGYDKNNNKIYGLMEFDLSSIENPKDVVIKEAWIEISNKTKAGKKHHIHYNLEFVDNIKECSYENIKDRERIEFIGYEVTGLELRIPKRHYFIFDSLSKEELENKIKMGENAHFIIKPTSSMVKNTMIEWVSEGKNKPKLVIKYIHKPQSVKQMCKNFKATIQHGKVKLSWDVKEEENFVGNYVVRNRFHPPKNPFDGDKIYAGKDKFTVDKFGDKDISKYYAIFTYDSVPNYSEPLILHYKGKD